MNCKFCGAPVKNGKCTFCGLDVKEYEAQTHSSCTSSSSYNLNGKEHKKKRFFHWHDENFDIFSADKKTRSKRYTLDQETYRNYNERQDKQTKHDYDVDDYHTSYSTPSTKKRNISTSADNEDTLSSIFSTISDISKRIQQTSSSSKSSSVRPYSSTKSNASSNQHIKSTSTSKTTYGSNPSSSHNQIFNPPKEQRSSFTKSIVTKKNEKPKRELKLASRIIRIIIILSILEILVSAIFSLLSSRNFSKFEDFFGNDYSINYENEDDTENDEDEDIDFSYILDEFFNR